jgi:hypothetical protein
VLDVEGNQAIQSAHIEQQSAVVQTAVPVASSIAERENRRRAKVGQGFVSPPQQTYLVLSRRIATPGLIPTAY